MFLWVWVSDFIMYFRQALDFVVSEARRYKMRLILSLCNNWEDYGGKAQYVRWGKEAGVDLTSEDDFFSDPTLKGYYKAFVEVNFWFRTSNSHRNGFLISIMLRDQWKSSYA